MHAEGSAGQSGVIVRCQAAARCQAARGAHTEGAETGAGGQAGPGVGVGHGGWAGGQDNQREVMHPNISTQSLRPRPYEQGSQHLQRPAAAQYHHPNVSQPGFQPQLSSHAGLSVGQSLTNTQLVHEPGLNIGGRESSLANGSSRYSNSDIFPLPGTIQGREHHGGAQPS